MINQIYINLPVKDLDASIAFFSKMGFTFDPQFTDETGTCMTVSENIFVMLLTEDKFKTFSPKPISDATQNTEVLLSLTVNERAKVDELVRDAIRAGGTVYNDPQDYGFMYGHGFQDLDGHTWELLYMDPEPQENK